ncbi:MAG: XdhC family protein, partial [Bacteroidia bacterium]|nr:XdhC family protein [Bacteroidia bacterium]
MKEIKNIIKAHDQLIAEGKSGALATVVSVHGSSYRRAGAPDADERKMGHWTGAISGGCLERGCPAAGTR